MTRPACRRPRRTRLLLLLALLACACGKTDVPSTGATEGGAGTGGADASVDGPIDAPYAVQTCPGVPRDAGSDDGKLTTQCVTASDCCLVDNCCECRALSAGELPAPCSDTSCERTACEAYGVAEPKCLFQQCTIDVPCHGQLPACDGGEPVKCAVGYFSVRSPDNSSCADKFCVSSSQCDYITGASCGVDSGFLLSGFGDETGGHERCAEIPDACAGDLTCACLAPAFCFPPYDRTCTAGREGFHGYSWDYIGCDSRGDR